MAFKHHIERRSIPADEAGLVSESSEKMSLSLKMQLVPEALDEATGEKVGRACFFGNSFLDDP